MNQKPESAELENLTAVLNAESGEKSEDECNFSQAKDSVIGLLHAEFPRLRTCLYFLGLPNLHIYLC